jgi:hypothetical protein
MKILSTFTPAFTPGVSGSGTLDFSQLPGFSVDKLYAVINVTQNTPIYVPGAPGLGLTSVVGPRLTLLLNTSTHSATDILNVYYEASNSPIEMNFAQESNGNLSRLIDIQTQVLTELRVMNNILVQGMNLNKDDLQGFREDIGRPDNIDNLLT